MNKPGCPLACLILVVAGICLLAYILMPIYASAFHQAKETHCQNNLKCIGQAFEMYRQDWGDMYPVAHNLHNDAYTWEPEAYHKDPQEPFWFEALGPYLQNSDYTWRHGPAADVLKCPHDVGTGMSWRQGHDSMYDYWRVHLKDPPYNRTHDLSTSYVWNGTLGWKDLWELSDGKDFRPRDNCHYRTLAEDGGGPSPKSQDMIRRPAARCLCWDWLGGWHRYRTAGNATYSAGWTVLFCDTHVRYIGWQDFDEIAQLPVEEAERAWWIPVELPSIPAPTDDAGDSG